ncbi:ribonuclease H-like domain-containing protein [Effusibacillus consociatus]|uniref:Ribonuclease H-like domain-containing protein n=1 Tax=Effusibacillus consociatus TaxID=1117041 RepID=A0ABV9Q982_9BACL
MTIVRKWWNGVLVYVEKGDPFMRVLQAIKKYPSCYFDSQNLCWHVADDYIHVLEQEAFGQGFQIDIPPERNLTRTLQNRCGCTFDIETTGLREDSNSHLVSACIGLSKENPIEFWVDEPFQEREVLLRIAEVLKEMDVIITWNGDRFDIPFLNERFKKYRIPFQINAVQSLDLYKIAEKMRSAGVIPSAALQVVERFYGIVRPDQLPGRYVPAKYAEWLETGNPALRDEILQHNREDVLFLLMLSPFIYQGIVMDDECAYDPEEVQLLDRYAIHIERLEKMMEEKLEMEQAIQKLAGKYGQPLLSRPYGDVLLTETACTFQKKEINSPPIRTFEELEEFYRNTLAQKPKRRWSE